MIYYSLTTRDSYLFVQHTSLEPRLFLADLIQEGQSINHNTLSSKKRKGTMEQWEKEHPTFFRLLLMRWMNLSIIENQNAIAIKIILNVCLNYQSDLTLIHWWRLIAYSFPLATNRVNYITSKKPARNDDEPFELSDNNLFWPSLHEEESSINRPGISSGCGAAGVRGFETNVPFAEQAIRWNRNHHGLFVAATGLVVGITESTEIEGFYEQQEKRHQCCEQRVHLSRFVVTDHCRRFAYGGRHELPRTSPEGLPRRPGRLSDTGVADGGLGGQWCCSTERFVPIQFVLRAQQGNHHGHVRNPRWGTDGRRIAHVTGPKTKQAPPIAHGQPRRPRTKRHSAQARWRRNYEEFCRCQGLLRCLWRDSLWPGDGTWNKPKKDSTIVLVRALPKERSLIGLCSIMRSAYRAMCFHKLALLRDV